jgi:single-strand DNA-binding protein
MQKIIIAGQLGQDAQSKEVGENVAISFNVAVNEKHGNEYACTLWRNKDEASVADYLKKGTGVIVEGTPQVETWLSQEKKEPQARIKIMVLDFYFMSDTSKKAEETAEAARFALFKSKKTT